MTDIKVDKDLLLFTGMFISIESINICNTHFGRMYHHLLATQQGSAKATFYSNALVLRCC